MDVSSSLALRPDLIPTLLSAEQIAQITALGEAAQVSFRCHLDIDQSVISTFDAVLGTNDRDVVVADPEQEVQRRVSEILEKRTLRLECVYVNPEGFEAELFSTTLPSLPEFVQLLRQQIEADVRREIEWTAMGAEGQDAALGSVLDAAADAAADAADVEDFNGAP